jgi:hypothetical protein
MTEKSFMIQVLGNTARLIQKHVTKQSPKSLYFSYTANLSLFILSQHNTQLVNPKLLTRHSE